MIEEPYRLNQLFIVFQWFKNRMTGSKWRAVKIETDETLPDMSIWRGGMSQVTYGR